MNRYIMLVAALAVAGCSNATSTERYSPAELARAASSITPTQVRGRIAFLADDYLRGRDTPSPGLDSAAAWIARELEGMGLEPGADGAWIQRYPYPLVGLDPRDTRFGISSGATHTLEYGVDFFAEAGADPGGGVGALYLGDADGLRRAAPDELRDRALLVRLDDALPQAVRGGYGFAGDARVTVDELRDRAYAAGAAALVVVMDPRVTPGEVGALAESASSATRVWGGRTDPRLPVFFLSREAALRLFRMAGLDGPEQLRRPAVDRPVPLPGVTVQVAASFRDLDEAAPPNVVGILRGDDPELAGTYVVISAHMDHLGVGRAVDGDSIYNGADDDASGVAAMLEVAQALTELPIPPRRSVLFLAVSGEEKGLLGSRWFARHPTIPMDDVVTNLNLDMVGRNAPDSIVVIGQEYSSLGARVQQVAADHPELGLTVSEDIWPEERFFFRSDHFSFAAEEVPALFFFAGTHEDYHRPGDEVDDIDLDKNTRVARLVFYLTAAIANDEQAPEWDAAGLAEVRRLTADRN